MPDLLTVLDAVADDMAKARPDLSESEIALSAIRLNLTVLAQTLAQLGMTGEGLTNAGLYGITTGIVETCEWILAKEMTWDSIESIERSANEE